MKLQLNGTIEFINPRSGDTKTFTPGIYDAQFDQQDGASWVVINHNGNSFGAALSFITQWTQNERKLMELKPGS